jgi:hypothetical protein
MATAESIFAFLMVKGFPIAILSAAVGGGILGRLYLINYNTAMVTVGVLCFAYLATFVMGMAVIG